MIRILALLTVIGLGFGVLIGPIERAMLYPFDPTQITPTEAGVPRLKEVILSHGDAQIVLWVAAPKPNKPVVFYLHGNAGNLANRAGRFRRFLDRGYGVIAPAYRGSSGSSGTPSETEIRADIEYIFANIAPLIPEVPPRQIILYGESLGTGVAIQLAITEPAKNVAGILLEAPYTSLPDVAQELYPMLEPLLAVMQNRWNSLAVASQITQPLLILHGDQDRLIPIEHGRQIHSAARSKSKQFAAIKGAGHTDIWRSDTLPMMWRFIDSYADR